ncbi:MAG: cytochrome c oxidase subunit II [Actinomycetota bacterium]
MRKKALWVLGLIALAVLLSACSPNNQQDSLDPKGPYAQKIDTLFQPVFWIAVAVFVIVEGGILLLIVKYRRRRHQAASIPPQIHGNTRLEIGWTILPALILVVIAVPTVTTVFELASKPTGDNVINVDVYGHQWWWQFDYTDPEIAFSESVPLKTANELVIPVDTPVYVTLLTEGGLITGDNPDYKVIHSFWPPELAGKQDAIPGREGHMTLQADDPGVYKGSCGEFCGLSHANMRFQVVAKTQEEFDAWVQQQKADGVPPTAGSAEAQGREIFASEEEQCIGCHTIQGIDGPTEGLPPAASNVAPALTHFASRDCFAGCIFERTDDPEEYREALAAWLRDPAAVKPGSKMPDYDLTEDQIDSLVAYLLSLE